MGKLITLRKWAQGIFGEGSVPHSNTLRRWAEDGPLKKYAVRIGKNYYIPSDVTQEAFTNPLHQKIEELKARL